MATKATSKTTRAKDTSDRDKTIAELEAKLKAAEEANQKQKNEHTERVTALENMMAELTAKIDMARTPQVVQVSNNTERVLFLWQAPVADENIYAIADGLYGRMVGATGSFEVPKNELSRAMDTMFRTFLDRRWIIVVSGLTEQERELYGVNYRKGEILDRGAFIKLVEMGEKILDIYEALCEDHKVIVAKRYHEAYLTNKASVKRDVVVELKRMSEDAPDAVIAYNAIIEMMNSKDAE